MLDQLLIAMNSIAMNSKPLREVLFGIAFELIVVGLDLM